jgi:flagellin
MSEIDRIAGSTEYNRVPLLNGSSSTFEIQVGTRNNPAVDRIQLFDSSATDVTTVALGMNLTSVNDKTSAQNSLGALDNALMSVTSIRAEFGALQNRLQSVSNNIMQGRENLAAANSRIRDTDMAEETSELTKNQILMQSGVSVLGQANSTIKSALNLLGSPG